MIDLKRDRTKPFLEPFGLLMCYLSWPRHGAWAYDFQRALICQV